MRKVTGFTTIELVIVITVIGIVSIFALTSLMDQVINVEAQAQQLVADLRYTQALSMTRGQRYRWVRVSSTTYQILNAAGTAMLLPRGTTTVTLNGNTAFGTLTNLPNNLIAFDGLGAPYVDSATPGTALATNATIPLTAGTNTETVVITPGTGRVTLQ